MILTDQERAYLLGLQESPVWRGLIKKLSNSEPLPRYSPKMEAKDPFHLWVYRSGGVDATEALLSILSLKETKLNSEDKSI